MPNIFNNTSEYLNLRPLVATSLHKEYGELVILDNENLSINPGDKIGLVGINGVGKTTLIRILAGLDYPDSGKVSSQEIKIGYLAQDYTMDGDKTVYEVATEGVVELAKAVAEFEIMSTNYQSGDTNFISRYDFLLNLLQTNNAFDLSERVETVLEHLKVGRKMDVKVGTLSGGQIVRLALARIIISKPNVLLLDEPTNHLDLHANLWLREFLKEWQGGLLIVSHDRDFLNEVTTNTWELAGGNVQQYGGNYEFYKKQKGFQEAAREREVVRLSSEVKKARKQVEKEKQRAAHSDRKDLSKKPDDFDKVRAHYFKERASKTSGRKKKLSENKMDETSNQLEEIKRKASAKISPNLRESENYNGKLLVSVGRLVPWKGFDTLIRLLPKIQKSFPETKLLIIGGGPQLKELKKYVESLNIQNKIIFTGAIPHNKLLKSSIISSCDLFVTASTTETQSLTIKSTVFWSNRIKFFQ